LVEAIAQRHGVSSAAVEHLLLELSAGGGRQAQFNHPELGGMGQWSQGGMVMVGDMFNHGLKARVDELCNELAEALQNASPFAFPPASQSQSQSSSAAGVSLFVGQPPCSRWPAELGQPSSEGSQNDLHYAVFSATRRLAIDHGGRITVYDMGDHQIRGFSQQQSGGQSLTFTSQHGLVRLADLPIMSSGVPSGSQVAPDQQRPSPPPSEAASTPSSGNADDEIFSRIERLAELRKKDIITAEEFDAKKAELLARL
jgi:hypothetical protein